MARDYQYKAIYFRETTNGVTKWVKIPGIQINKQWQTDTFRLRIDRLQHWEQNKQMFSLQYDQYDEKVE